MLIAVCGPVVEGAPAKAAASTPPPTPMTTNVKHKFSTVQEGLDKLKSVFTNTLKGISTKFDTKEKQEAAGADARAATDKASKATLAAIKATEKAAVAATDHAVKSATEEVAAGIAASNQAVKAALEDCNVHLVQQLSKNHCEYGTTFGCSDGNKLFMYTKGGCGGKFEMDGMPLSCSSVGKKPTYVQCPLPKPKKTAKRHYGRKEIEAVLKTYMQEKATVKRLKKGINEMKHEISQQNKEKREIAKEETQYARSKARHKKLEQDILRLKNEVVANAGKHKGELAPTSGPSASPTDLAQPTVSPAAKAATSAQHSHGLSTTEYWLLAISIAFVCLSAIGGTCFYLYLNWDKVHDQESDSVERRGLLDDDDDEANINAAELKHLQEAYAEAVAQRDELAAFKKAVEENPEQVAAEALRKLEAEKSDVEPTPGSPMGIQVGDGDGVPDGAK